MIPDLLRGGVHVPLLSGTTLQEALVMANRFYQSSLKLEDFHPAEVFQLSDGRLAMELIGAASNEPELVFINKASVHREPPKKTRKIPNPLACPFGSVKWLTSPLRVHSALELEFLDGLRMGLSNPVFFDNSMAWKLAQLLKSYQVLGNWVAGSLGEYACGGFKLIYRGDSKDCPVEYQVGDSRLLIILEIKNGKHRGYLCLKT